MEEYSIYEIDFEKGNNSGWKKICDWCVRHTNNGRVVSIGKNNFDETKWQKSITAQFWCSSESAVKRRNLYGKGIRCSKKFLEKI